MGLWISKLPLFDLNKNEVLDSKVNKVDIL
jgi:hypothetical protein